jgi:hypothetical protein
MNQARGCSVVRAAAYCAAGVVVLLAQPGCAPRPQVTLLQPHAPPAQRAIQLVGDWTYFEQTGSRRRYLLAFPLPGAMTGARDFLIYLAAPTGTGVFSIGVNDATGAQGFLIQKVGLLAGRTNFSRGAVRVQDVPFRPHARQLELDILCGDGTQIVGRVLAAHSPAELTAFDRRYAADIAQLSATVTRDHALLADEQPDSVEGDEPTRRASSREDAPTESFSR